MSRSIADRMRLPYPNGTDHDQEAADYIGKLINNREAPAWCWEALFVPERINQTYRGLAIIHRNVQAQYAQRRAAFGAVRADYHAGQITHAELRQARVAYEEWKARIAHFERAVVARMQEAREHRKAARIAEAQARDARLDWPVACGRLVQAIAQHRATVEAEFEPTTADRLLWSRLELMRLPDGTPVTDLIKRVAIEPRPQPGDADDRD
jgi:Fe-S cluster assembly scaffold protein SufB